MSYIERPEKGRRSLEAALSLIDKLLEDIERNPPAIEARRSLIQLYEESGHTEAADDAAKELQHLEAILKGSTAKKFGEKLPTQEQGLLEARTHASDIISESNTALPRSKTELDIDLSTRGSTIEEHYPLHRAAMNVNIDALRALINAKADVNARDSQRETPLHMAARNGIIFVVRFLLNAGADVNAIDRQHETPLHKAAERIERDVVRFLLDAGAKINARDTQGETPLHMAAGYGNIFVVRFLLDGGADRNATNLKGYTPLDVASSTSLKGHILKALIKTGADIKAHGSDNTPLQGRTTLMEVDEQPKSKFALRQNAMGIRSSFSEHSTVSPVTTGSINKPGPSLRSLLVGHELLEKSIYEHSFLALCDEARSPEALLKAALSARAKTDLGLLDVSMDIPHEIMEYYENIVLSTSHNLLFDVALIRLFLLHEVSELLCTNFRRLQTAQDVEDKIHILVTDEGRGRYDVVRWTTLTYIRLRGLVPLFRSMLETFYKLRSEPSLESAAQIHERIRSLHNECQILMNELGLHSKLEEMEALERFLKSLNFSGDDLEHLLNDCMDFWLCTLQTIDLSILAHVRRHTSELDMKSTISLPVYPGTHIKTMVQVRPRYMKCLQPFLGSRPVWVFEKAAWSKFAENMYLATDIKTFSDVWGPVWNVRHGDAFLRYNVGGGSILPWPSDESGHPKMLTGERLCHWVDRSELIRLNLDAPEGRYDDNSTVLEFESDSDSTSSLASMDHVTDQLRKDILAQRPFTGSETLLIGANCSDITLQWKRCRCSAPNLLQELKQARRLDRLDSSKVFCYIDSQQTSAVVGYQGVSIGASRTYRVNPAVLMKKGLLESWENEPFLRHPIEFENFWGIAVSLCTMNARRVRLVELLNEDSMLNLLERFPWRSEDLRRAFFEAINSTSPFALRKLWQEQEAWHEELGKVLLSCLRILSKTGYDQNTDTFSILWMPSSRRAPQRVTLKPEDQKWVKFLKESTFSMSMAVMVTDSLIGRRQRRPCSSERPRWFEYPSMLETAICVHTAKHPVESLELTERYHDDCSKSWRWGDKSWEMMWSLSGIRPRDSFWVGHQGRLITSGCPTDCILEAKVDFVMRDFVRQLLGQPLWEREGHWEYTDEEDGLPTTRPIPVRIVS